MTMARLIFLFLLLVSCLSFGEVTRIVTDTTDQPVPYGAIVQFLDRPNLTAEQTQLAWAALTPAAQQLRLAKYGQPYVVAGDLPFEQKLVHWFQDAWSAQVFMI